MQLSDSSLMLPRVCHLLRVIFGLEQPNSTWKASEFHGTAQFRLGLGIPAVLEPKHSDPWFMKCGYVVKRGRFQLPRASAFRSFRAPHELIDGPQAATGGFKAWARLI